MKEYIVEIMRFILTILVIAVILVITSIAQAETVYYIIDDRNVVKVYSPDPVGEEKVVYVDCQDENNSDPIGCIIVTHYSKEKQKLTEASAKNTGKKWGVRNNSPIL